ncbi:type II secretion system minor pseudopilin GspI [Serratia ficaria]|uniref:type II secretion system minor pseudopilin GspI n=1 Tax=Serratia ficaria TaxID=61651 RepID=UPI0021B8042D|nr:type II secretion system minor pseudopilin GspI [Serratia ficaria]
MKRSEWQQGMTLLEVMVAMVIFAVGCLTIARTVGQQTHGVSSMEKKIVAGWVADNQLALLAINNIRPTAFWSEGQEEMAGGNWYWRYRSRQTTDSDIIAVDVEVSDTPAFAPSILQVRTWLR